MVKIRKYKKIYRFKDGLKIESQIILNPQPYLELISNKPVLPCIIDLSSGDPIPYLNGFFLSLEADPSRIEEIQLHLSCRISTNTTSKEQAFYRRSQFIQFAHFIRRALLALGIDK